METTGEKLKKIRLEKGISLEEVQKKTKIHLNILKAIEGESLTNLSPVYLKSFLRIYCKFLGVDPKDFVPDYKEPQAKVAIITSAKNTSTGPNKFLELLSAVKIKLSTFRPSRKIRRNFVFILIIILVSFGLFNLGKFISSKRKTHLTEVKLSNNQQKRVKTVTSKSVPPTAVTKPKTAVAISGKKDFSQGIRLGIKAKENCWVSLKVDGRLVFQRVLQKGRFESWQAKDKMELALGSAGAVELEVNGQLFTNLGKKGQTLKNIVITKEGLKIGR